MSLIILKVSKRSFKSKFDILRNCVDDREVMLRMSKSLLIITFKAIETFPKAFDVNYNKMISYRISKS